MNKDEYLESITLKIKEIISDKQFINNYKQLIAWKQKASFKRTYNEDFIWSKITFISNNSCLLILENKGSRLSNEALKISAEIYENLSCISEKYDKHYCSILSALCYDLSGYQANAYCMLKSLDKYSFKYFDDNDSLIHENYILSQIQLIILKNAFLIRNRIDRELDKDLGIKIFNDAIQAWSNHALDGISGDFSEKFDNCYRYYLNTYNLPISHILFLLKARLQVYIDKSIWNKLTQFDHIKSNPIWQKYIKLLTYDVYGNQSIKDVNKRISKFELWISQLRAIEDGLLNEEHNFVLQMPTSAGKTFIAELSILDHLVKYPTKKCIYIAPFRALTSEKEVELSHNLSKLGYSVSALSGSYELDEFQNLMLQDSDVLIATPEKLDLLLRMTPEYFKLVSLLVIDEGHIIGDFSTRASLLEFLIIRLRIKIENLKTLFISAVMPPENSDQYSLWLNESKDYVIRSLLYSDSNVNEQWEPTRKLIGKLDWEKSQKADIVYESKNLSDAEGNGAFVPRYVERTEFGQSIFPRKNNKAEISTMLAYKLAKDGPTLVFCATIYGGVESVAKSFLRLFSLLDNIDDYCLKKRTSDSYYFSQKWYGEEHYISKCIEHQIGIHFGNMPEQVRNAVENDYRKGNLRILVSTNTIGQGLNFPIKNLVIHKTIMGENLQVSYRDFWNIIGRAGRAGSETEGKIIFVINSYTDRQKYVKYIDKSYIEPAHSVFFTSLQAKIKNIISSEDYESIIAILSESYLFELLYEEDEDLVEVLINNSLFNVQLKEASIDVKPIKLALDNLFTKLKGELSKDEASLYSKTGLSLNSNIRISNYIEENLEDLSNLVTSDSYIEFLVKVIFFLETNKCEEFTSDHLDFMLVNMTKYTEFFLSWIGGIDISIIRKQWVKQGYEIDDFFILLSEGFYYRFAWCITSFITIISSKLDYELKDFPENIKNLSSYLKYGLNNKTACLARSIGIRNRETSILLSDKSDSKTGRKFLQWLNNLTDEEVNTLEITNFDKQNILNVINRLTLSQANSIQKLKQFSIQGISNESNRIASALAITVESKLLLKRDKSNKYDPYAIKVLNLDNELGYVPRELSKFIAVEMDINNKNLNIEVLSVKIDMEFPEITIRILDNE